MADNRPDSKSLPPYDWQSKPVTQDTDAAIKDVLRDASKPK